MNATRAAIGCPSSAQAVTRNSRPSRRPKLKPNRRSVAAGRFRIVVQLIPAMARIAQAIPIPPRSRRILRVLSVSESIQIPRPATMAASTIRLSRPFSQAPRGLARICSRAVSPSTPSSTELTCTRIPPMTGRSTARRKAAAMPKARAMVDSMFGDRRSGARVMESRVETGRFT